MNLMSPAVIQPIVKRILAIIFAFSCFGLPLLYITIYPLSEMFGNPKITKILTSLVLFVSLKAWYIFLLILFLKAFTGRFHVLIRYGKRHHGKLALNYAMCSLLMLVTLIALYIPIAYAVFFKLK
jgi:hypothetical protein